MNSQIQPPKALPLHMVGWMSMPWRHWIYIGASLTFGILFLMFSQAPFIARVLVLVVPTFLSFVLAWPYGGLHLDEWIVLSARHLFRVRLDGVTQYEGAPPTQPKGRQVTATRTRSQRPGTKKGSAATQQPKTIGGLLLAMLKGSSGRGRQEVDALPEGTAADLEIEASLLGGQSTASTPLLAIAQPGMPATPVSNPATTQMHLTGSYGLLRRSYEALPPSPGAPPPMGQGAMPPMSDQPSLPSVYPFARGAPTSTRQGHQPHPYAQPQSGWEARKERREKP